ncbi:DNA integrity scanning diadenylate cyclase DisA [Corynebacterium liangguodongii]|uniref:DNA integrity scanning protein DisA n=1 Tax=Corynebacterium liangguodongii TaxID=2079535 RepID=A0A2S0WFY8_9CORY|nr:DNA integrity scanning diadenylate cyclase DisA [Corynebacterium liangguodongii]AWB84646.1 DNA integrity scanning protein DisA [Corynebacterium liangguodongii]PWB99654.1 DNA integrity scanning protein DisA [Corynebacterium liangguodongii]
MTTPSDPSARLRDTLELLAPGTALRDGLERIQRGHTGGLIVLGDDDAVVDICDGGIEFDVPFSPTLLRELSKMDGAVVLSSDLSRIVRANVQLVPSPSYPTAETGTRHRAAERTALHTGVPTVSVSASMNTLTLYAHGQRHLLDEPAVLTARANQALSTVERYRGRLDLAGQRLFVAEMNDYATVADVLNVLQRQLMLQRAVGDMDRGIVELGVDSRQLALQLTELRGTIDEDVEMLVRDYIAAATVPGDEQVAEALASLGQLPDSELLNTALLARALGLPATEENLMQSVAPRGYRALSRVPRVQKFLMDHVVAEFGTLAELLSADPERLAGAEHVSPLWARHIYEGLRRMA